MAAPTFARRGAQRGLTLIEACVTFAVIGVLATAAFPSLRSTLERHALQGLATELATDLQQARGEAVARQRAVRVAAQAAEGGSCVLSYVGPADGCRCGSAAAPVCQAGALPVTHRFVPTHLGVTVSANVGSILFDPRLGTATPAGTLRLQAADGRAVHHVVNLMGRVRSCSPGATVPALPAC